ncbi:hydantoinase/oxoprolinase family protein [Ferruginivarius sediminum]|uniref:Hydantoinase/oxoprolinase family protein n=1 Tax=Ferruginivarius sediminum TaxID=2661937 RepID=A0A369TBG4_9PROT|nr:hydantoinase/oxoprolinase family protein [Ferruginivarius sediminum]RDD62192.1 hydantoinase/oxoprolinase family protein [Ferruginivarius sediminum]
MSLRIAIDTGGTFTDVVAIDEGSGKQYVIKTPSTPSNPSEGLLDGISKVLEAAGRTGKEVTQLLHGSTTATNAVLEHKFDGLGLIVTKGFRHLIEIARQSVPDGYGNSLFWVKPPRLVPLHLVREAPGRLDQTGAELEALDEAATMEAVDALVEQGVKCIGVCLLHSYANGAHEERVGRLIADRYPDVFVSLSSRVLPEYREYERAMTTLIDVMVKPYCQTYLQRASDSVNEEAGDIPFLIMQSNGGVVKHKTAGQRPVTMLLSGPAGGVLGAVHMSRLAGYENILTLDVGGTSTDMSLVTGLEPQMTSYSMIENYPVKTPMLDIVTVGTGGGSLAWVDDYENLKVGPHSSGAVPGPICYRRGGQQPTVTDAAAVLGRLPEALVGGELELDIGSAQAAYRDLGKQFGMSPEEVAAGVFEIATANMVHGIRQVTTTRGRDPSGYALISFGGAGALFACEVAEFLGVRTVLSPPNPGNLSAYGLHVCDVKQDYIRTLVRQESTADTIEIEANWQDLEATGRAEIVSEGVPENKVRLHRFADMRYVGEGHEVNVAIPEGASGEDAIAFMWEDFHRVHHETFGFDYRGEQDVELVNLRVQAIGEANRPKVAERPDRDGAGEPASMRRIYWRGHGWVECDIYNRVELALEQTVQGPTVIEEYGSTVVVSPSWAARTDKYGNLILEKTDA